MTVVAAGIVASGSVSAAAVPAAAVVPVAPPGASPSLSHPVTTVDTCSAVRAELARDAAAGVARVACLGPAPNSTRSPAVSIPSQCTAGYDIAYTRFDDCISDSYLYNIFDTVTGVSLGNTTLTVTLYNHLAYNSRTWTEHVIVAFTEVFGDAAMSTFTAPIQCIDANNSDCAVASTTTDIWEGQDNSLPVTSNAVYSGPLSFRSQAPGTQFQNFQVALTIDNVAAVNQASADLTTVNQQRCDSLSYFPNAAGGCVYYEFPYAMFSLSLSNPKVGQAAQTIDNGQASIPNHVGQPGSGVPLTRDANKADIAANRKLACKGIPPSCDEYPFASTHQGASLVAPGFYFTATIIAAQNSYAGSLLGSFYYKNRIADGDAFYARATP